MGTIRKRVFVTCSLKVCLPPRAGLSANSHSSLVLATRKKDWFDGGNWKFVKKMPGKAITALGKKKKETYLLILLQNVRE